jgi:hypothetical protein
VAIINGVISLSFSPGSLLFSQKEVSYGFEILHGLLSNKNSRIPTKKKLGGPPLPSDYGIFGGTNFEKMS